MKMTHYNVTSENLAMIANDSKKIICNFLENENVNRELIDKLRNKMFFTFSDISFFDKMKNKLFNRDGFDGFINCLVLSEYKSGLLYYKN